jgi:exodeoxyribonuclease VII large subunit
VSPLNTLERGYAIVQDKTGRVIRKAGQVQPGDTVTARLAEGALDTVVRAVIPGGKER